MACARSGASASLSAAVRFSACWGPTAPARPPPFPCLVVCWSHWRRRPGGRVFYQNRAHARQTDDRRRAAGNRALSHHLRRLKSALLGPDVACRPHKAPDSGHGERVIRRGHRGENRVIHRRLVVPAPRPLSRSPNIFFHSSSSYFLSHFPFPFPTLFCIERGLDNGDRFILTMLHGVPTRSSSVDRTTVSG